MQLFHIHTKRCNHASEELDEDYVKTAIYLGATSITFTDHAPFPFNPFGSRMDIEELDEYISSLNSLKEKYSDKIDIKIGLEVEYLPEFLNYYKELKSKGLILVLGQHFYCHEDGEFSFTDDSEFKNKNEHKGCAKAIIEGMKTGFFDVVVHPDRIFRRIKTWNTDAQNVAKSIISVASENSVSLEINLSSYENFIKKKNKTYWKNEFWNLVKNSNLPIKLILGLDAHSTEEMKNRVNYTNDEFIKSLIEK